MENSGLPIFLNCFSNRKGIGSSDLSHLTRRALMAKTFAQKGLEDFRSEGAGRLSLRRAGCQVVTTATGGQKSLQVFGPDPSLGSNIRESVGITASSDLTFDSKFRNRSRSGCSNHARCTHHDENRNLTVWAICPEYNVAHSANCHFLHNKSSFLLCMGTSVSLHGVELLSAHRGTAWCDRLRFPV